MKLPVNKKGCGNDPNDQRHVGLRGCRAAAAYIANPQSNASKSQSAENKGESIKFSLHSSKNIIKNADCKNQRDQHNTD